MSRRHGRRRRWLWLALAPPLAAMMMLLSLTGGVSTDALVRSPCSNAYPAGLVSRVAILTPPTYVTLSMPQMELAAKIVSRLASYDIRATDRHQLYVIGIIVAMVEGTLKENPPHNDRDSEGPFAQRARYYGHFIGVERAVDMLVYGVRLPDGRRVPGLLDIEGWNTRPPGDVAADLQRPDEQYRGRYAGWVTMAEQMLAGSTIDTTQLVSDISCLSSFDMSDTARIERILAFVQSQMGKPYRYGADGPDAYDCSGLIKAAASSVGMSWPHYSGDQYALGPNVAGTGPDSSSEVRLAALQRGDLLFWGRDGSEHEAIYAGNGMMYAAPHSGDVVKLQPVYWNNFWGATRPFAGKPISGGSYGAWANPVDEKMVVTSLFGLRFHPVLHVWKLHDGVDFGLACGTPLRAMIGGSLSRGYNSAIGNFIQINDGDGVLIRYYHMSGYVPGLVDGHVAPGEPLGYVGSTGLSTGCHLHLYMNIDGRVVNPLPVMQSHGLSVIIPGSL